MAYDTNEERLKVRGSEQITRDLKVNRDAFVLGNLEANKIKSNGDLDVQGELIARKDLSVSGDLYVNGTEHINDTETAQTSDDYLVLRHNKTTALGANEHAGVVVHNYMPNKTATLTTDNTGTWRVADNTETDTNYSAISYYNGTYYDGLGQTTSVTVINGIKSAWDEDELDECVFYNNGYYHFDGTNYFTVELSGNVMALGAMVTDPDVITALEALTGNDLVYYRSLTVTTISEVENEPILTRDEASNLTNDNFLAWDSTGEKAVDSGMSPSSFAPVATSGSYNDLIDKPTIPGVVDAVTDGDANAVSSNAVYDFVTSKELDWDNAIDVYLWHQGSGSSGPIRVDTPYTAPKKGIIFPLDKAEYRTDIPYNQTVTSGTAYPTGQLTYIGSLDTGGSNNKTVDIQLNGTVVGSLHYNVELIKNNYSSGTPETILGGAYPDKALRRIYVETGDILKATSSSWPTMQGRPQSVGSYWTFVPYKG